MPGAALSSPMAARYLPAMPSEAPSSIDKRNHEEQTMTSLLKSIVVATVFTLQQPALPAAAQARGPAQGRGQAPAAPTAPAPPTPRLPNGHPDLSGVWMGGGGIAARNLKPGDQIVLTP